MTANGRELVFPVSVGRPYKTITAYEVLALRTDTANGTVAQRSRVLLRHSGYDVAFAAAVISPAGRVLYLCSSRGGSTVGSCRAALVAYRARDMRPYATLVRFSGQDGCSRTELDPTGRWLLVPYAVTAPRVFGQTGTQHDAWGGRGKTTSPESTQRQAREATCNSGHPPASDR